MEDRATNRTGIDVEALRSFAEQRDNACPDGDSLTNHEVALIRLATAASTTSLDLPVIRAAATDVLALGGTPGQLTEVLMLVAPLGMHTLHEGVRELIPILRTTFPEVLDSPLDDHRSALKATFESGSSYWQRLERELPGFLDGLLRLSPQAYEAFFHFCAVAWQTSELSALQKELVYLAIDATPTHRYGPGFRLHLENVRLLGGSQQQVNETLRLAAAAAPHAGIE